MCLALSRTAGAVYRAGRHPGTLVRLPPSKITRAQSLSTTSSIQRHRSLYKHNLRANAILPRTERRKLASLGEAQCVGFSLATRLCLLWRKADGVRNIGVAVEVFARDNLQLWGPLRSYSTFTLSVLRREESCENHACTAEFKEKFMRDYGVRQSCCELQTFVTY